MTNFVDSEKEYEKLVEILERCRRFAFRCVTSNKEKMSPITIAAIDIEDKGIFVFDVQVYGLNDRIQKIFGDPDVTKVMFDCRRDSDSLYYAYGTILNGVVDLQVMDYIIRYSERAGELIGTLLGTVEQVFGSQAARKLKEAKQQMASAQSQVYDWLEGPSRRDLVEYLAEEIRWLFPVFYELTAKYKKDRPMLTAEKVAEVKFYSTMYAASSSETKTADSQHPYHNHNFMPWGIFQPRPIGNVQCTGCRHFFPESHCQRLHFEPTKPKCVVCASVRLHIEQGTESPTYDPSYEHVTEFKVNSPDYTSNSLDVDNNDTDDSGVSLPDRIPSYQCQRHQSFPSPRVKTKTYSASL